MINLIKKAAGAWARGYGLDAPSLLNPRATWATVCTPDDIIAAQIIESFVKEFDDWKYDGDFAAFTLQPKPYKATEDGETDSTFKLTKKDKSLIVLGKRHHKRWWKKSGDPYKTTTTGYYATLFSGSVNEIPFSSDAMKRVYEEYLRIDAAYKEASRVAEKAKADMEVNEKKWELAERLSGMVRNGQGALIPKPKWMYTGHPASRLKKGTFATGDPEVLFEICPDCGDKTRARTLDNHKQIAYCPAGCGHGVFAE